MVLAVVDDDAHVVHRETGDGARGEDLLDALAHRRHELMRNDTALGRVNELEARSARPRLDAQRHFSELTCAAGLLLVAVETVRRRSDRFAIRNARWPGLDLQLELCRHALENRAQMQLSQRAQHGLVAVRIVLDHQGRVLRRQPMQHLPDSLLVAALFRRQRDTLHRRRELQRTHVDVVLVV